MIQEKLNDSCSVAQKFSPYHQCQDGVRDSSSDWSNGELLFVYQ